MIVVDTSVWSAALRRPREGMLPPPGRLLRSLVEAGEPVVLLGIVMQELLSGIRHGAQFRKLERTLEPFPLVLATNADHIEAARVLNRCRANGVQTGSIDALIVAMTMQRDGLLLTADRDYVHMSQYVEFNLQFMES